MQYAEIAVNVPVGVNATFTYFIPSNVVVTIGQLVSVPLKNNLVEGIIFSIYTSKKIRNDVKSINNVIYTKSLVTYKNLVLSRYISQYYMKPLFSVAVSFFPPGFRNSIKKFLLLNKKHILGFSKGKELINLGKVRSGNLIEIEEKKYFNFIKENYDREEIDSFSQTEKIKKFYKLSPPLIKKSYICFINLYSKTPTNILEQLKKRAPKQWELIHSLNLKGKQSFSTVRKMFGTQIINGCFEKSLIYFEWDSTNRNEDSQQYKKTVDLESVSPELKSILPIGLTVKPILLHCSSMSKKIEAYFSLIQQMLFKGKQILIVCPDLQRVRQIYDEIVKFFDYQTGIFSSEDNQVKRLNTWMEINTGKLQIIIGTKGALFCSFKNLGLVIIDDEESYSDHLLDFNNRFEFDVRVLAIQIAKQNKALTVLSSLSPSISSYFRAQKKQYAFVFYDSTILSPVKINSQIIDMSQEVKNGNYSIISQHLVEQLNKVKSESGKTLLFFNRRGESIFIRCNSCFESIKCKDCLISFRYHSGPARLICNSCSNQKPLPLICDICSSQDFQKIGYGIQRVEKELHTLLPQHKIIRWDSDILPKKLSKKFWNNLPNDFDIVIGTVGVIRYLEFLKINFVGLISIEQELQMNDFRSVEKQYQLLSRFFNFLETKIVENKGIVIQSFQPEWYLLKSLINRNYITFYDEEIRKRKKRSLPPFLRLTKLSYSHFNREKVKVAADKIAKMLRNQIHLSKSKDSVIGPFPSYPEIVDSKYNWELFLKGKDPSIHLRRIKIPHGWHIEIDT